MRTSWSCMFVALTLLAACDEPADAEEPEAVEPVEVTGDEATQTASAEAEPDVAALAARVEELERQLATQNGETPPAGGTEAAEPVAQQQGGTQVATVPDDVDVPDEDGSGGGSNSGSNSGSSASTGSSRRRGNGSLLGALLGDEQGSNSGRRRGRRDDDEEPSNGNQGTLPNPVDVLLGP